LIRWGKESKKVEIEKQPSNKLILFGLLLGLLVSSLNQTITVTAMTTTVSWHWLFFVNLPFGVSAVCLLAIGHRENRIKHKLIIDWPGAITLCGSVIAILLA
jgi:MFS family permease